MKYQYHKLILSLSSRIKKNKKIQTHGDARRRLQGEKQERVMWS